MVEIECLVCGKAVKIPQYISIDNYDGQLVCQECESLLHVKLVKGKVQKYKIVEKKIRPVTIMYKPAHEAEEEEDRVKDKED